MWKAIIPGVAIAVGLYLAVAGWMDYIHVLISHIDEKGNACKPFLLPQKDTGFYDRFMMSYNIPEFITGKVKVGGRVLGLKAKEDKGIDVKFAK